MPEVWGTGSHSSVEDSGLLVGMCVSVHVGALMACGVHAGVSVFGPVFIHSHTLHRSGTPRGTPAPAVDEISPISLPKLALTSPTASVKPTCMPSLAR